MLNKKLRQLRMEIGLSQVDFAKILRVRSYTISDWEHGRSEPSCEDIKKICIFLNISADELLEIDCEEERKKFALKYNLV